MSARGGGVPRQLTLHGFGPSRVELSVEAELARFRVKVVVDPRPGGCHHWVGAIGDDGYGRSRPAAGLARGRCGRMCEAALADRPDLRVGGLAQHAGERLQQRPRDGRAALHQRPKVPQCYPVADELAVSGDRG